MLKSEIIVNDELWGFYNSNPYFSPDDKYIIYNAYRDFETDIFTYNIESKKITNITNTKVSESNPIWSPDGKYVYFSSDKLQPGYPFGTTNSKIYQMSLDKFEAPFKFDEISKLFKEEEKKDESRIMSFSNFVTESYDEDEVEEGKMLWDNQISSLKQVLVVNINTMCMQKKCEPRLAFLI